MPKTTTWVQPPHTGAKHAIVREYLVRWFPIMASVDRKLIYFDGFAGPGRYASGEDGSPIVALKALLEHARRDHILATTEVVFVFVEADADRHQSLVEELEALKVGIGGAWPANMQVLPMHASFVDHATTIVKQLKASGVQMAPTFALIDPFGFSGVPMDVIAELLQFRKCELLFNLIFDPVNWHLHNDTVGHHMRDLFGCDDYQDLKGLSGEPRREAILDLYVRQLKAKVGFKYVRPFEMWNDRNRLGTVLVPGTRHPTGFLKMKEAMWAVDPTGRFTFSDIEAMEAASGVQSLFGEEEVGGPSFVELDREIRFRFSERTVKVEDVEKFVIEETRYLPTHYKRNVLVPLERDRRLVVDEGTRNKQRTYPKGTTMTFPVFG